MSKQRPEVGDIVRVYSIYPYAPDYYIFGRLIAFSDAISVYTVLIYKRNGKIGKVYASEGGIELAPDNIDERIPIPDLPEWVKVNYENY